MYYYELQQKLKEHNAILLDVRSKESFYNFHIEEAISLPLEQITLQIEQIIPNKDQALFIICDYGIKSDKAFELLSSMGYSNLVNINKISNIIF